MPSQNKSKKSVSSAAGWKGKKAIVTAVELPSGNICKVRRISIAKLMAEGAFPDELQALVSDKVTTAQGKGAPKVETDKVQSLNTKDMSVFLEAIDKVAVMVVAEPKVVRPVVIEDGVERDLEDDERDINVLYVDEVDLEDKIFVFQFAVGGGSDLNDFRSSLGSAVGSMGDGEGVESSPV